MLLPGTKYRDQNEIDAQYNMLYHFWLQHDPYADYFMLESNKFREQYQPLDNVRVGARDEERVDVFKSAKPSSPILVFVHGGWWSMPCDSKFFQMIGRGFVERGYTVVFTEYTLCPKVGIPDITNATRSAVAWAYENAADINGDRDRLFVSGHSAGGQQTGMMAITDWSQFGLPVDVMKGGVPISGVFDLRPFEFSFLQPKLRLSTGDAIAESPILHIPTQAPPLLVNVGGEESALFQTESEDFVAAWQQAGHQASYLPIANENHMTNMYRLANPDSELCTAMDEFFRAC